MARPSASPDAGFTLMEVIIALALFSLISLAALGMLTSLLSTSEHTQVELARMTRLQRAMFLMTQDFEQAAGPVTVKGDLVTFTRNAAGADADAPAPVAYRLRDRRLERRVGPDPASPPQALVDDVAGLEWRFFTPGAGWRAEAPQTGDRPEAVAVTIVLRGDKSAPVQTLRRVFRLPAGP